MAARYTKAATKTRPEHRLALGQLPFGYQKMQLRDVHACSVMIAQD